ncbi:nuclear transport factor 2 family protein [Chlorobium sp. KB01]|uniref:nuclear transport factor 2 family protein n=1 Tax=Chlorobium sp. KB01 TaxID=1917528 RepID=UPI0009760E90|nr:nuclear transport factor 2 family protein [Chlorobium sp. KB01]
MNSNSRATLDVVLQFLDNYSKQDIDACLSAFSSVKELKLLGTNDNEVFSSLQEIREAFSRDFTSMANIRFGEIRHSHVESVDTLATVLVELPITFE